MPQQYALELFPQLAEFVSEQRRALDQIPPPRKAELEELGRYVRRRRQAGGLVKLTFICTHNSRRSQLTQIWAKVAAELHSLPEVQTFSGGTEATAMNPRVVQSLQRSGFRVATAGGSQGNPLYRVSYAERAEPLMCFSKVFDAAPNPAKGYCAVMTCSSADEACPIVAGCELRLPIRYEDPKAADGTSQEAEMYDERSAQICREMLYAMQIATQG